MTIKISDMLDATLPLGGAELVELVQGASTRKAAVNSLAPKALSAALGVDVQMPTANTWYDGPSIVLPAGKWMVSAFLTHVRATTTAAFVYGRITNGAASTHYASSQGYHPSLTNSGVPLSMAAIIDLAAETTIKLQAATSVGSASSLIKAAMTANGSGNNATQIVAVRVS